MPPVVHPRRKIAAALLACVFALSACTTTDHLDEYNEIQQGNAHPADSPPAADITTGRTVDVAGPVRAMVSAGDQVVLQFGDRDKLLIGTVSGAQWLAGSTVDLPDSAGPAVPGIDGRVLVPFADGVLVVNKDGSTETIDGIGPVTAAAQLPDGRLATGNDTGVVTIRQPDGAIDNEIPGLTTVDRLVVARDGSLSALSRPDTVFASIDPGANEAGPLLRAGRGAGQVARYSQSATIVSDTVGNALLVYSTSPVALHQMFPVPEAPWAVAEDPVRNVVWTTSTGTNQVVAYDLRDGQGHERARIATVSQPDSMIVTDSGTVVVASAVDGVLHLLEPTLEAISDGTG